MCLLTSNRSTVQYLCKKGKKSELVSCKLVPVLWICDRLKARQDRRAEGCVCLLPCMRVYLSEGECDGARRQVRAETSVLSLLYNSNIKPQGSCHFATKAMPLCDRVTYRETFVCMCVSQKHSGQQAVLDVVLLRSFGCPWNKQNPEKFQIAVLHRVKFLCWLPDKLSIVTRLQEDTGPGRKVVPYTIPQ